MSDETNTSNQSTQGWASDPAPERVGFCQDCGRPLTAETIRPVGTGVFCEPCLTARVGTTATGTASTAVPPYAAVPPYIAVPPAAAALQGEPHPVLAGFLGLIPGVGAMYNGQFAKGIVHLIIFAVLVSLKDNVSEVFGIFIFGWICYMAFEAYHTAKARLEGLPLPNAFGFNDIGERMGFGKHWPTTPPTWASPRPPAPATGATVPPVANVTPTPAPDWVGYIPPTEFGAAAQHKAPSFSGAAYAQAPYAETYAGTVYAAVPPVAAVPITTARRFPTGAFWLIGLGLVILLANIVPDWQISGRWWPPVLFAGLAVWTFTRRLKSGTRLVCILRWPVILMTLAIMFALHAAYFDVTFGLTCSVLLIVIGGLLLLERTAGAGPAQVIAEPARASFTATGPAVTAEPTSPEDDATKGGL